MRYISKRYAPLLTRYDVQMLFGWIKDACGSIAKAAKVTGVRRKTVYDWGALKEEVRLETKLKVLEQSMNLDENRTIQFLIRKSENNINDVLQHYLRYLYENSMKATSEKDFSKHVEFFHNIQNNHRGAIFDNQPGEVEEMNKALSARAQDFQMKLAKSPLTLVPPEIMAEEILALLKILRTNRIRIEEMKKTINLPNDYIDEICEALNYLEPGKEVGREFEDLSEVNIGGVPRLCIDNNFGHIAVGQPLNPLAAAKEKE